MLKSHKKAVLGSQKHSRLLKHFMGRMPSEDPSAYAPRQALQQPGVFFSDAHSDNCSMRSGKFPALADDLDQLKETIRRLKQELSKSKATPKAQTSNPAVIGLAGFATTTVMLQLHKFGLMGFGPIVWCGLIFGGIVQLIAGLQMFSVTGENFGYCAFSSYGAFWISLSLMKIADQQGFYKSTQEDQTWFVIVFLVFTLIMLFASVRTSTALFLVFAAVAVGFMFEIGAIFGHADGANIAAAVSHMIAGLMAWYCMAHIIYSEVYGRNMLPVGPPITVLLSRAFWPESKPSEDKAAGEIKTMPDSNC